MTPFQVVGLVLALAIIPGLGICVRLYSRKNWTGARGVLWREVAGTTLILGVAAGYQFMFKPPFDGLITAGLLGLEVLFVILLLDRAGALQDEPWEGVTENGRLRHGALHLIEDMAAIADRAAVHQRTLQRDLVMWKLMNQALRALEPTRSLGEWERMVDEVLEGMRGEDWPGR